MPYRGADIPDVLSVKGIVTVHSPDLSREGLDSGETHDFPEMFFVERGEHTLIIDQSTYTLKGRQMIIYAPNSHHRGIRPSGASVSIISFEVASTVLNPLYNRVLTLSVEQERVFKEIFKAAKECFVSRPSSEMLFGMKLRDDADGYVVQRVKLKLEMFLTDLLEAEKTPKSKASKSEKWDEEYTDALAFLKENVSQTLTLEDMAKGLNMSVSKLKLLFRKNYGGGPLSCFNELKIEEAKRLIGNGEMNFTEISEQLGFSSLHYFSRAFKKLTGSSPSEYKNKKY